MEKTISKNTYNHIKSQISIMVNDMKYNLIENDVGCLTKPIIFELNRLEKIDQNLSLSDVKKLIKLYKYLITFHYFFEYEEVQYVPLKNLKLIFEAK